MRTMNTVQVRKSRWNQGLMVLGLSLFLTSAGASAQTMSNCDETEKSAQTELAEFNSQDLMKSDTQVCQERRPETERTDRQQIRENQLQRRADWERGFIRGFGSGGA
ncbi:MAG: hypothetical protein EOP09_00840 [Proteobacteria bacterium]|nr:MAG: hypothetical protein EOP09_00840 [Pseudomonadota bacterium]